MTNENDLIRRGDLEKGLKSLTGMFTDELGFVVGLDAVLRKVEAAKSVDAVELPKGKIGEYVLWKHGAGEMLSPIEAIALDKDGLRYCFRLRSVPVDSPKILQIMSQEEAKKWWEDFEREKTLSEKGEAMANERRLIDAYTLAEEIESLTVTVAGKPAKWNDAKHSVLRILAEQPDVDAVEVVRCFGCQHFDAVDEMEGGGYCNHPRFHIDNAEPPIVHAADFCSYGERKDDGNL